MASTACAAAIAGVLVADGYGESLLIALAGVIVLAAIVLRPDLALLAWVGVLLASGRDFSRLEVGPVYVTEPFLLAMVLAIGLRLLWMRPRPGQVVTLLLVALLALPAAAGLLLRTTLSDPAWMRQFAIIHYSAFAVVASTLAQYPRFLPRLAVVTLVGAAVGLAIVLAEGQTAVTSTGALRIAHGSYAIPFGVAPLLVLGLAREGLVRKGAVLATLPLVAGLILTNHRSGWIAFAVALVVLLASRPAAGPRLALLAIGLAAAVVFVAVAVYAPTSSVGMAAERATTVFETEDPNAAYRLSFWSALIEASMASPLFGSGFDPYPPEFVPAKSTRGDVDYAPHNSFVALAYRIGPIFLFAALALLGWLLFAALRLTRRETDPGWRFALTGSAAAVVYIAVFAAFNVVLELPYMAVLFWVAVGVLAAVVAARSWPAQPDGVPTRASRRS